MNKNLKLFCTLLVCLALCFLVTTKQTTLFALETTQQVNQMQTVEKVGNSQNENTLENKETNNLENNTVDKIEKESGTQTLDNETKIQTLENENEESFRVETEITCDDCKIKVTGLGNICVKPDTGTIKFAISTLKESADGIETENTKKVNSIISKLQEVNISKENIKNISYSMFKKYDYKDGEQVFLGYEISNILEIKTNDLSNITSVIKCLTENDVIEIYSLNLTLKDNVNAYNQALTKALENAKTKAKILCENKNIKVCKIIECPENYNNLNLARYDAKTLNSENFAEILQNEICVKAQILVEFCVEK